MGSFADNACAFGNYFRCLAPVSQMLQSMEEIFLGRMEKGARKCVKRVTRIEGYTRNSPRTFMFPQWDTHMHPDEAVSVHYYG